MYSQNNLYIKWEFVLNCHDIHSKVWYELQIYSTTELIIKFFAYTDFWMHSYLKRQQEQKNMYLAKIKKNLYKQ